MSSNSSTSTGASPAPAPASGSPKVRTKQTPMGLMALTVLRLLGLTPFQTLQFTYRKSEGCRCCPTTTCGCDGSDGGCGDWCTAGWSEDYESGEKSCPGGSTTITVNIAFVPLLVITVCVESKSDCEFTYSNVPNKTREATFEGSELDFGKFIETHMKEDGVHLVSLTKNDVDLLDYELYQGYEKPHEEWKNAEKRGKALFELLQEKCKEVQDGKATADDVIKVISSLL